MVIPFEERGNYMNMLASQDTISLSGLLEWLNQKEKMRMHKFGIKMG